MATKAKKATADKEIITGSDKKAALETVMQRIERECGKGSIMRLGENAAMNVSAVSTGSLSLDFALGIGGIPRGRITEIYGPESSGKTTIALHVIAEVQKQGGEAAFIDAEHALDPVYAKKLGVDINNLLVSQPDCGEQALEIAETLVNSGAIDIIVIDSVAALVPRQEIEGDMGASHVGVQARLMSQAMRKLSGAIAKSNCIVIFTNQLREKVGVMYGNPEVTTGGKALKFYASVRIDVRRVESLKNGSEVYGSHTRCKVVKNKVAPPLRLLSLIFFTAREFPSQVRLSIWRSSLRSLKRAAPGSITTARDSVRVRTTCVSLSSLTRSLWISSRHLFVKRLRIWTPPRSRLLVTTTLKSRILTTSFNLWQSSNILRN